MIYQRPGPSYRHQAHHTVWAQPDTAGQGGAWTTALCCLVALLAGVALYLGSI